MNNVHTSALISKVASSRQSERRIKTITPCVIEQLYRNLQQNSKLLRYVIFNDDQGCLRMSEWWYSSNVFSSCIKYHSGALVHSKCWKLTNTLRASRKSKLQRIYTLKSWCILYKSWFMHNTSNIPDCRSRCLGLSPVLIGWHRLSCTVATLPVQLGLTSP